MPFVRTLQRKRTRSAHVTMNHHSAADRRYGTLMAVLFNFPVTQWAIGSVIRNLQKYPSAWRKIPPLYGDLVDDLPELQDFDCPHVVDKQDEPNHPGVQRWFIASPAMRRIVEVQVIPAQGSNGPAPMLYLLDGVSAPRTSGWLREGQLEQFRSRFDVNIVMPTQAPGSLYTDWVADDPKVGRHQWDTFLSKELIAVMEDPAHELPYNGTRVIGGLSMGASGAVRIAARHPELYAGAIGLSGCYSNTSPMGRGMTLAILRSVDANPDNVWGPDINGRLNPAAYAADILQNPEGLRNLPLYLFAANGEITQHDIENHIGHPRHEIPGAVFLEYASYRSTRELVDEMEARGMHHHTVHLQKGGVHAWNYYGAELVRGWEVVTSHPDFAK